MTDLDVVSVADRPELTDRFWSLPNPRRREPADPWLRVHVRLGARVVKVAPLSMTIPGTLDDWRARTGLPFDADGFIDVPGALAPVLTDTAQGHAVYVEPNVWVHHRL